MNLDWRGPRPLTDTKLAAICLWHLTFYGFTPEEQRANFDRENEELERERRNDELANEEKHKRRDAPQYVSNSLISWRLPDSNRPPSDCEPDALPDELNPLPDSGGKDKKYF